MLWRMSLFHSLYGGIISLYTDLVHFIYPSANEHLGVSPCCFNELTNALLLKSGRVGFHCLKLNKTGIDKTFSLTAPT